MFPEEDEYGDDEEYEEMMEAIKNAPVRPYNIKKERIH